MAYNQQAPNAFVYNGNPNGAVAGNAGTTANGPPPDLCWDYVGGNMWACITTGSTSTAVWGPISQAPASSVPVGAILSTYANLGGF